MFGIAFQPVGYHCPRFLSLLPTQRDLSKQLRVKNRESNLVKVAEVDVSKYQPDEVNCKVESSKVIVSAQHRVENKHGYETSEFQRAYNLPEDVDPETVKTSIQNGILYVRAGQRKPEEENTEDDKKVSLRVNLGSYKPEEVDVEWNGNELVVSAERKTEEEGVHTYRQFKQHFTLPNEADPSTLVTKFNEDGVLRIEAEKKMLAAIEERSTDVQPEEEMTDETEE